MAFDGLFIHSLLQDLTPTLVDSRLSKIYQPFDQDLVLIFRKNRKNYQFLISANAQYSRMYLTDQSIANPDKAPIFVMVLRKYLEGSVLQSIEQVGLNRIVNFHFSNRNELGDQVKLVLSVELMGRHSNVILYDQQNNHIIDLLKRINPDENRARILLPKAKYELPPLKPGLNGLTLSENEFKQLSSKYQPDELAKQMDGLDRDDRNELIGYLEDDYSYSSFKTFFDQFNNPRAFVLKTPRNKRKIFCYLPYHLDLEKESSNPDLNKGLDDFYEVQRSKEWIKQRVYQATNPKAGTPLKVVKRAKRFCRKRSITEFVDGGISWNTIAKRLGCGFGKVKQVIMYGELNNMFVKHCHIKHFDFVLGRAQEYVEYSDEKNLFATKKNNNVYSFACNTYSLC